VHLDARASCAVLVSVTVSAPEIIHRDADLLIVHKPSGLPTTAPSPDDACLVRWVEEQFPGLHAHPTSRLDSPVSGLVTFALNKAANQRLLDARRSGTYERLYLGVTLHELEAPNGLWTWPISIDPRNAKLRIAGEGKGERDASTRYEVGAHAPHASLLRLEPRSGRTHQLRVHAAKAGAPLFGDHAYGGERRLTLSDGSVVSARRAMLHCARVGFPWKSSFIRFEAQAPPDMERIWSALGGQRSSLTA
jgi:23S rRNA pseudouridine1911/1915/1917 synthase